MFQIMEWRSAFKSGVIVCCLMLLGCSPAAQPMEEAASAQTPPATTSGGAVVADVSYDAFARFEVSLESDVQVAPIEVALPMLGLPQAGADGNLESGPTAETPTQRWARDDGGYWYTQVSELEVGRVAIEGSRLRAADAVADGATATPTIDAPAITMGTDGAEDEVRADFVLGNVAYSATLYCNADALEYCTTEDLTRELITSLAMFQPQERQQ